MPLITQTFPKLERAQQSEEGDANARAVEEVFEHYDEDYSDFKEGEENDDDMDGKSMLHRPRPKKQGLAIPELPAKNQLRSSQILENLTIELSALEQAAIDDTRNQSTPDPHEHYLSSEEEASESADEYDESFIELDSDHPPSSPAESRRSHEVVARVVSFMFVGKPTIIDVLTEKSQQTKALEPPRPDLRRRPSPLKLTPTIKSTSYIRPATSRSSSLGAPTNITETANFKSGISILASKANFLAHDPFPASEATETATPTDNPSSDAIPQPENPEPKTPSHIAKDAWKGINRHFTLATKSSRKPSLSSLRALNTTFTPSTTVLQPVQSDVQATSIPTPTSATSTATPGSPSSQAPVTYEDIMRSVIRTPPAAPSPVKRSSRGIAGFVRGRGLRA